MSGVLKKATGLTGLAVSANPHHSLTALYGKILRTLNKMPANAAYRKHTEIVVKERAQIVATTPDIATMEKKIGCGQIEEVITQAENELQLSRNMLGWKPWEKLRQEAPLGQWDWPPAQIKTINP